MDGSKPKTEDEIIFSRIYCYECGRQYATYGNFIQHLARTHKIED